MARVRFGGEEEEAAVVAPDGERPIEGRERFAAARDRGVGGEERPRRVPRPLGEALEAVLEEEDPRAGLAGAARGLKVGERAPLVLVRDARREPVELEGLVG